MIVEVAQLGSHVVDPLRRVPGPVLHDRRLHRVELALVFAQDLRIALDDLGEEVGEEALEPGLPPPLRLGDRRDEGGGVAIGVDEDDALLIEREGETGLREVGVGPVGDEDRPRDRVVVRARLGVEGGRDVRVELDPHVVGVLSGGPLLRGEDGDKRRPGTGDLIDLARFESFADEVMHRRLSSGPGWNLPAGTVRGARSPAVDDRTRDRRGDAAAQRAAYSSSPTGASHSFEVFSPGTAIARCENQESARAPCQCSTFAGIETTSPGARGRAGSPFA